MSVSITNTDANVSGKTVVIAENAQTVTGLQTFDRDPNPPFAVSANSAVVTNLDADKLDGQEGTSYFRTDAISSNSVQPRAGVYNNTTQSINDATNTALTFNTEDFDVGTMHDTGSNTSRLTIPASAGGLYWVDANATFATNATGYRQLFIRKNGTTNVLSGVINLGNATTVTQVNCSGLVVLAAADYLEVMAFQSSGGALNVGSATREFSAQFQIVKLW